MTPLKFPDELVRLERAVSRITEISIDDIRSDDRNAHFVEARHILWCLAAREMGFHVTYLARFYGKDHTTILHAVRNKFTLHQRMYFVTRVLEIYPNAFSDETRRICRAIRVRGPRKRSALSPHKKSGDMVTQ